MEGSLAGNYRIVRKLSEGGMGAVYEVVHTQLGKRAVLKALRPEFAHRSDMVQRMLDEARSVNLIEHPGLVDVFDCGEFPDHTAYILMEFLRGESLNNRLARGPMAIDMALRLGRQIADAMTATHSKGIVHRDLKPDNIMIIADPEVASGERTKILDFGIAKVRADLANGEATRQLTQNGMLLGTPTYMSPEQCRGAGQVDERSDVYSFGVILYRMLSGSAPFVAEGMGEIMLLHMSQPPPSLAAKAPDAPAALVTLIHKMLAKDRADRPSMLAVKEGLERLIKFGGPTAAQAIPRHSEGDTVMVQGAATVFGGLVEEVSARTPNTSDLHRTSKVGVLSARQSIRIFSGLAVVLAFTVVWALWFFGNGLHRRPQPSVTPATAVGKLPADDSARLPPDPPSPPPAELPQPAVLRTSTTPTPTSTPTSAQSAPSQGSAARLPATSLQPAAPRPTEKPDQRTAAPASAQPPAASQNAQIGKPEPRIGTPAAAQPVAAGQATQTGKPVQRPASPVAAQPAAASQTSQTGKPAPLTAAPVAAQPAADSQTSQTGKPTQRPASPVAAQPSTAAPTPQTGKPAPLTTTPVAARPAAAAQTPQTGKPAPLTAAPASVQPAAAQTTRSGKPEPRTATPATTKPTSTPQPARKDKGHVDPALFD